MDTDDLINTARFYVRRVQRLRRGARAPLPTLVEAAAWMNAEAAAARLRRLAALAERQPVPVPIKRKRA